MPAKKASESICWGNLRTESFLFEKPAFAVDMTKTCRAKREERKWNCGSICVGSLTLKKNMSAPPPTQPAEEIIVTHRKGGKTRLMLVFEKWKKSTGCNGSRARLMAALGSVECKFGPKLIRRVAEESCVGGSPHCSREKFWKTTSVWKINLLRYWKILDVKLKRPTLRQTQKSSRSKNKRDFSPIKYLQMKKLSPLAVVLCT